MSERDSGPLVLMYHRVGIPGRPSPVNGQYVSPRSFALQMALLLRLGYRLVPLGDVAAHLRGRQRLNCRDVAITFDDGFANLYTHVFPVVVRHSIPTTIFLISSYIGKQNTYHSADEDLYEPLLSAAQIHEMQNAGVTFGSHTQNHARLTECDRRQLVDEIQGSRVQLEDLLGRKVDAFCYPYGAENEIVRSHVIDAGYNYACSTRKGRNDRGDDPYRIRRINVRADTIIPVFLYKLWRSRTFNR